MLWRVGGVRFPGKKCSTLLLGGGWVSNFQEKLVTTFTFEFKIVFCGFCIGIVTRCLSDATFDLQRVAFFDGLLIR